MLLVFKSDRYDEKLEVYVGITGMELRFTTRKGTYSHFLRGIPRTFLESAKVALKPYAGYYHGFNMDNMRFHGEFRAGQREQEWTTLSMHVQGDYMSLAMRKTELQKLVQVIEDYWTE